MSWISLTLMALPGLASAQVADPTRPPDASNEKRAGKTPADTAGMAVGGLQVTIVRRGGKSVAVVDGQQVKVGDKLGERRVLAISATDIVLQGAAGRDVIKLIPSIDKQVVKPATEKNTPREGGKP